MDINEEKKKIHVHTWKIENFSMSSMKKGECLTSPVFKVKSFEETSWSLDLYPGGGNQSKDGYISCYINRKKDDLGPFAIECDFKIEIINKTFQTVKFLKGTVKFEKGTGWGLADFMKIDELMKTAIYEDTLTIRSTLCRNTLENSIYSKSTSFTKIKMSKHSFQWVIKNLNSITHQEVIKIPCSGASHLKIVIQIPEDDVKICVSIDENFSAIQSVACNFSLLDVKGKERHSKQATHLFETMETWEFPTFIKKSQLNAEKDLYIKDNGFTLQCDVSISDGSTVEDIEEKEDSSLTENYTFSDKDTIADLNTDIKRMYADKIHTDINLKANGEVFPAHKSVLCVRSPVFTAMFDNDMAESHTGEVDIPDAGSKTVNLFLEYLYTGAVNELDYEKAMKLIVIADKYQVLSLKNKCSEWLKSILSDANVCEILVTADLIQQNSLKVAAFDYIRKQPDKIFNTEEWKYCVKNNFELATETLCEVSRLWGNQKEQSGK